MSVLCRSDRRRGTHLPPGQRVPALSAPQPSTHPVPLDAADGATFAALAAGAIDPVGQLTDASNGVFLVAVDGVRADGGRGYAVLKPVRYERPLWDFPDGTLAGREVAACLVDRAGGWGLVPATVLRTDPPAALQRWVGALPPGIPDDPDAPEDSAGPAPASARDRRRDGAAQRRRPGGAAELHDPEDAHVVTLVAADRPTPGWLPVLPAQLADGTDVVVAHADLPRLASLAVLDAALNNTDRKGSHVLKDSTGALWGIDHGVSLHAEDKLRTILWGWQGDPLPAVDVERLRRLEAYLRADGADSLAAALALHITTAEIAALRRRVERLLSAGVFPAPSGDWHSIPWPPL
ncbi:MAG: SCO1664 family protein [Austwickia sp.]|nr:SCO1664 family protein [Actinomycetota bacterium]MCB1254415.1 SCO1664 family protein [Austwickia sp.]MCO5308143.1 SCO1664 family protein [Austwickia sp.]